MIAILAILAMQAVPDIQPIQVKIFKPYFTTEAIQATIAAAAKGKGRVSHQEREVLNADRRLLGEPKAVLLELTSRRQILWIPLTKRFY